LEGEEETDVEGERLGLLDRVDAFWPAFDDRRASARERVHGAREYGGDLA